MEHPFPIMGDAGTPADTLLLPVLAPANTQALVKRRCEHPNTCNKNLGSQQALPLYDGNHAEVMMNSLTKREKRTARVVLKTLPNYSNAVL